MDCDPKYLRNFLDKKLGVNKKLELLLHLDHCNSCWTVVYQAIKAKHQASATAVSSVSNQEK